MTPLRYTWITQELATAHGGVSTEQTRGRDYDLNLA